MDTELIMDEKQPTPSAKTSNLGNRLKTAREKLHLTEKDAAQRLHLNPKYISMMEDENFETANIPPTFMRGYLRSYAKLLNINEAEINATLRQIETDAKTSPIATPTTPLRIPIAKKNDFYIQWITYGIVIILIAMVGFWWTSHSSYNGAESVPTATQAPTAAPAATPTAETLSPTQESVSSVTSETAAPTPPPEPVMTAPSAPVQPSVPAPLSTDLKAPTVGEILNSSPAEEAPAAKTKHRHVRVHEEPTHVSLPEPGLEDLD